MPRQKYALLLFAILVGAIAALLPFQIRAEEAHATRELVVGTKVAPPFAIKDEKGDWSGISIELWSRIASSLGLRFRFVESDNVISLLDGVGSGNLDVAVAAITVTPQRARNVDFTMPYLRVGTGVAVHVGPATNWLPVIRSLMSYGFLQAVLALLGLSFLAGMLIWLFERKANDGFAGSTSRGLSTGVWWSTAAMTQRVGGGVIPVTLPGRIVAMIWMVVSVIAIAVFTAGLTSALTTRRLQGTVTRVADLASVKVGVVQGTAAEDRLAQLRIRFETVPNIQQGFSKLRRQQLDALVYDRPILAWLIQQGHASSIDLADVTFGPQDYAIALKNGSDLRKRVDIALLEAVQSDWWKETLVRYLGRVSSSGGEES